MNIRSFFGPAVLFLFILILVSPIPVWADSAGAESPKAERVPYDILQRSRDGVSPQAWLKTFKGVGRKSSEDTEAVSSLLTQITTLSVSIILIQAVLTLTAVALMAFGTRKISKWITKHE